MEGSMKTVFKIVVSSLLLVGAVQVQAYTFTFRNKTNIAVDLAMQLVGVGEKHHQKTIVANGEVQFKFDGWSIGLCMDANTVKIAKSGEPLKERPVAWVSQAVYQKVLDEMKQNTKTSLGSDIFYTRTPLICRNQAFDIVFDKDGNLCVIMMWDLF